MRTRYRYSAFASNTPNMTSTLKSEALNTVTLLQKGKVIAYPTETIWGIGCNADNLEAIERIFSIKKREKGKSLLVLVDELDTVLKYKPHLNELEKGLLLAPSPTTVILDGIQNFPAALKGTNNSLAFRITQHPFCKAVIQQTKIPLVSTSANISGEKSATCKKELSAAIVNCVDHVVNYVASKPEPGANQLEQKASRIVKVVEGKVITIRA